MVLDRFAIRRRSLAVPGRALLVAAVKVVGACFRAEQRRAQAVGHH